MEILRLLSDSESPFAEALSLYKTSFPAHEQRDQLAQKKTFEEDEYHFDLVYDQGQFVGLILYWETETFIYVEHFCIRDELRNKKYGQKILTELRKKQKTIILEIDPPNDEISKRRQNFYQRAGYNINPFNHVHPPYRHNAEGHTLVVMSCPEILTDTEYNTFNEYLKNTVMRVTTRSGEAK